MVRHCSAAQGRGVRWRDAGYSQAMVPRSGAEQSIALMVQISKGGSMKIAVYELKVTFLTPVLGTQPQKDVASEYLGEKVGVQSDELETLPELLEKGTTVFHRLPDTHEPLYNDFHVMGLLKEAGQAFNGK